MSNIYSSIPRIRLFIGLSEQVTQKTKKSSSPPIYGKKIENNEKNKPREKCQSKAPNVKKHIEKILCNDLYNNKKYGIKKKTVKYELTVLMRSIGVGRTAPVWW